MEIRKTMIKPATLACEWSALTTRLSSTTSLTVSKAYCSLTTSDYLEASWRLYTSAYGHGFNITKAIINTISVGFIIIISTIIISITIIIVITIVIFIILTRNLIFIP